MFCLILRLWRRRQLTLRYPHRNGFIRQILDLFFHGSQPVLHRLELIEQDVGGLRGPDVFPPLISRIDRREGHGSGQHHGQTGYDDRCPDMRYPARHMHDVMIADMGHRSDITHPADFTAVRMSA